MNRRFLFAVLAPIFIEVYFLGQARDAFHSYFGPDALMDIYLSWIYSATALVEANFLFFLNMGPVRPMTSALLRVIFDVAGFHPLLFHAVTLVFLTANIWLTYCVSKRLTGSREAAVLAALLISYHGRFMPLYFDIGYFYDVTCYFFYFCGFLYYLRIRSQPRLPRWWELAALSALYICAMNSKEMAVTFPVFLLVYEWLYRRPALDSLHAFRSWILTEGRPILITGVLTLAFIYGRASGGALLSLPAYQPHFTAERFMASSRNFVSELFSQKYTWPSSAVLITWLILFAAAWASKSRGLKFAWLFLMLAVLPVAFIDPRGAAQYYIPLFGWVLYAAVALVEGAKWLFSRVNVTKRIAEARPIILFLAAAFLMYWVNSRSSWAEVWTISEEAEQLRSIDTQLHQLRPAIPNSARILFLDDPIDEPWRLMYLVQLSYGDRSLVIDRAKFMKQPIAAGQIASYDCVFDYVKGRFYTSPQGLKSGPSVVYDWAAEVFHADWRRVTERDPARRGEAVISMLEDLGETDPPVGPRQPFPKDPFAQVRAAVLVKVDGQPAEVTLKFGWPEKVNAYRVDFRIPEKARPGERNVTVTCQDATGPPVLIFIK